MTEKKLRRLTIGIYAGVSVVLFGASVAFSCLYLHSEKKLENAQADLGEIHAVKTALEETNEELVSRNEALISENEELTGSVEELNETVRQMNDETDANRALIEQKHIEAQELSAQILQLQEENNAADDQIAELQQRLDEATAESEGLEASVKSLEQQIDSRTKTLERWQERNRTLNSTVSELRDDLKETVGTLKETEDKLEAAHDRIEELESAPPTVVYLPAETTPPPKPASTPVTAVVQETPTEPGTPAAELMTLLQSGAPLKWVRDGAGGFVKVYPHLAYCYLDLTTGEEATYNADEALYSASLIKAPYIYTVLREIEAFEAGEHERDANGKIVYQPGEEKYDLSEIWIYDPNTMWEAGSGVIIEKEAGFSLTWKELIEYALLYSDNVAFAQVRQRFGYSSFYQAVAELGVVGTASDFMNLSARDCAKFLKDMYGFFETGGELAAMMKADMARSKHPEMIVCHYPEGMASHKYGWDVGAFHDMAIVFDEKPYAIVIMTDYEDGGDEPVNFFGDVVELTKRIHAEGE